MSGPLAPRSAAEGAQPLWRRIEADLRRRVAAGEFADSFPGELALTASYQVSRHTIREALRALRADGLVTAARGRTPRVATEGPIEQPLGALYSLFASVEQAGLDQHSEIRALVVRQDPDAAARLGLDPASPLVYLERLRLADGSPLALDRVWLPAALAGGLLGADFRHTSLYDELARCCDVRLTGGSERIRAVVPTAAQRRALDLGAGEAAFAVERHGSRGSGPVEFRHTVIRGDRFVLTADFSARAGYRLGVSALETDLSASPG